MSRNLNEFQRYINEDFFCVSLTGDEYCIEEALRLVKETFSSYDFEAFFPGEEERLLSGINTMDIFSDKKIIIIYNPENLNQNTRKELIAFLRKTRLKNKKFILISEKEKSLIQFNCKLFKFSPIYEDEIDSWIKEFVEKNDCSISDEAVSMIRLLFGNDRKEIVSFIKPFLSLKRKIDKNDLFRFNIIRENAVFESLENFFKKDLKRTIESFIISESEYKYYALLLRELNNLIDLKLKKNVDKFKNSFIMKKNLNRLDFWELEELFMVLKSFLELESKIKIGYNPFDTTIINIFKLLKGGKHGYG